MPNLYVIYVINIIDLIIFLSLKVGVNLNAKIQALENTNKTDHRDTQTQTEVFNGELISASQYKNREAQPKIFRQPNLLHLVTFQEFQMSEALLELCGPLSQC